MTMVEADSAWATAIGDAIRTELGTRAQRWLAEQAGMDPATISRFVLGKQLPTLDQIDDLARALNTSRRLLLTRAGYIDSEGDIDLSLVSPGIRAALLGAYEAGLRSGERAQGAADDGGGVG